MGGLKGGGYVRTAKDYTKSNKVADIVSYLVKTGSSLDKEYGLIKSGQSKMSKKYRDMIVVVVEGSRENRELAADLGLLPEDQVEPIKKKGKKK